MNKQIDDTNHGNFALLIDGDNAQPKLLPKILAEAGKYGSLTIRRIYGDWTTSNMNGWKVSLNNHAIQPIQQFRYTVGKNATDSAMIIDAMDLLHSGLVDGFCVVSSDSDYTRLSTRIRESGIFVLGIGRKTTPKPFVNACDVFIYTENLEEEEEEATPSTAGQAQRRRKHQDHSKADDALPLLTEAFEMAVQEDGWALLSTMGSNLHKLDPGFDPRSYGFKQLSQMFMYFSKIFEVRFQEYKGRTTVYVKIKDNNG